MTPRYMLFAVVGIGMPLLMAIAGWPRATRAARGVALAGGIPGLIDKAQVDAAPQVHRVLARK